MVLPNYRAWVVVASLTVCLGTWFLIERTQPRRDLRAGTENPALVQAFGINVPLMVTLTYAGGAGLAALAGVLAAPVIQVTPLMGSSLIIVVFAVVVIGGMGSILGSILTGLGARPGRGADQGLLSRGLEHRRLRDHGDRPDGPAGRPVRQGDVMSDAEASPHPPTRRRALALATSRSSGCCCWSRRRSSASIRCS